MKNFRKFIVIVLMALVTVSLVACSQKRACWMTSKSSMKATVGTALLIWTTKNQFEHG